MKKGKLTEKYKVINNGELSYVDKFRCKDDQIYEDEGKKYLKIEYTDEITLLLPIESVEDCVDSNVEKEERPAKTILRKLFHKKVKKNLDNWKKSIIFVSEKGNKQNTTIMDIITTIFTTILAIFIGIVVLMIFIQCNVDLWNEMGKELFKGTRIWMWYKNHKNKVKILSDMEYDQMMKSGKIKSIIVVEN